MVNQNSRIDRASLLLEQGQTLAAAELIHSVLAQDYLRPEAWVLLTQQFGGTLPPAQFQFAFTAKYYPERLDSLPQPSRDSNNISTQYCPACGTRRGKDHQYCGDCGYHFFDLPVEDMPEMVNPQISGKDSEIEEAHRERAFTNSKKSPVAMLFMAWGLLIVGFVPFGAYTLNLVLQLTAFVLTIYLIRRPDRLSRINGWLILVCWILIQGIGFVVGFMIGAGWL